MEVKDLPQEDQLALLKEYLVEHEIPHMSISKQDGTLLRIADHEGNELLDEYLDKLSLPE